MRGALMVLFVAAAAAAKGNDVMTVEQQKLVTTLRAHGVHKISLDDAVSYVSNMSIAKLGTKSSEAMASVKNRLRQSIFEYRTGWVALTGDHARRRRLSALDSWASDVETIGEAFSNGETTGLDDLHSRFVAITCTGGIPNANLVNAIDAELPDQLDFTATITNALTCLCQSSWELGTPAHLTLHNSLKTVLLDGNTDESYLAQLTVALTNTVPGFMSSTGMCSSTCQEMFVSMLQLGFAAANHADIGNMQQYGGLPAAHTARVPTSFTTCMCTRIDYPNMLVGLFPPGDEWGTIKAFINAFVEGEGLEAFGSNPSTESDGTNSLYKYTSRVAAFTDWWTPPDRTNLCSTDCVDTIKDFYTLALWPVCKNIWPSLVEDEISAAVTTDCPSESELDSLGTSYTSVMCSTRMTNFSGIVEEIKPYMLQGFEQSDTIGYVRMGKTIATAFYGPTAKGGGWCSEPEYPNALAKTFQLSSRINVKQLENSYCEEHSVVNFQLAFVIPPNNDYYTRGWDIKQKLATLYGVESWRIDETNVVTSNTSVTVDFYINSYSDQNDGDDIANRINLKTDPVLSEALSAVNVTSASKTGGATHERDCTTVMTPGILTATELDSMIADFWHCFCDYWTGPGDVFPVVEAKITEYDANPPDDWGRAVADTMKKGMRAAKTCSSLRCRDFFTAGFNLVDEMSGASSAGITYQGESACTLQHATSCWGGSCWPLNMASNPPASCAACYAPTDPVSSSRYPMAHFSDEVDRSVYFATCAWASDCPADDVQTYVTTQTLSVGTTETAFNDAAQEAFKQGYADLISANDMGAVSADDVVITSVSTDNGQLQVTVEVSTYSVSVSATAETVMNNVASGTAGSSIGGVSVSSATAPEQTTVAFSPPPPPMAPWAAPGTGDDDDSSTGMLIGIIAGAAGGSLCVGVLVGVFVMLLLKRKKKSAQGVEGDKATTATADAVKV